MGYQVKVKIEGVSPLLQHRFAQGSQKKSKRKTGSIDYSKEAEKAIYRDETGQIYQPASHIEGAMIKAAVNFQIEGKGKKTYKDLTKAAVIVEPSAIPHIQPKYKIDARPVVIQRARIIRCRPRFDKWSLEFTLTVVDDQMPLEVIQEILEYAGRFVGIGDFRPKFGRFRIVEFKRAA